MSVRNIVYNLGDDSSLVDSEEMSLVCCSSWREYSFKRCQLLRT